ncbi:MAG TPA: hypothetical protein VF765_10190 [Polyangiaceae bacterium]
MSARTSVVYAVVLALAPVAACSGAGEQGAAAAMDGGTEGGAEEGGTCADGEMAAILAATNQAEVDATMQLRASLVDPKAVDLAEKMLTDHALVLEQLQGAMRAGAIASRSGGISQAIADAAEHDRTTIAASTSIDSAYADREVLWHVRDQALLDTVVAPAVRGTRLAFVATSMQDLEKQHVALALALQGELDATCR